MSTEELDDAPFTYMDQNGAVRQLSPTEIKKRRKKILAAPLVMQEARFMLAALVALQKDNPQEAFYLIQAELTTKSSINSRKDIAAEHGISQLSLNASVLSARVKLATFLRAEIENYYKKRHPLDWENQIKRAYPNFFNTVVGLPSRPLGRLGAR